MIQVPKKTQRPQLEPHTAPKPAASRTHRRRGGRRQRGPGAREVGGPVGAHLAVEHRGRPRRAQQQRKARGALHLRLSPRRWRGGAGGLAPAAAR